MISQELVKNTTETDKQYVTRINNTVITITEEAIIDEKGWESHTGLSIIRARIKSGLPVKIPNLPRLCIKIAQKQSLKGQVEVALKIFRGQIYADLSRMSFVSSSFRTPVYVLELEKFDFEDDDEYGYRMQNLALIPLGNAKPSPNEYNIGEELLPFYVKTRDYAIKSIDFNKFNCLLDRKEEGKVVSAADSFRLYGHIDNRGKAFDLEVYSDVYGSSIPVVKSLVPIDNNGTVVTPPVPVPVSPEIPVPVVDQPEIIDPINIDSGSQRTQEPEVDIKIGKHRWTFSKTLTLAAAIVLLGSASWYTCVYTKTPSYAVGIIAQAAQNGNQAVLNKYVGPEFIDSVDDSIDKAARKLEGRKMDTIDSLVKDLKTLFHKYVGGAVYAGDLVAGKGRNDTAVHSFYDKQVGNIEVKGIRDGFEHDGSATAVVSIYHKKLNRDFDLIIQMEKRTPSFMTFISNPTAPVWHMTHVNNFDKLFVTVQQATIHALERYDRRIEEEINSKVKTTIEYNRPVTEETGLIDTLFSWAKKTASTYSLHNAILSFKVTVSDVSGKGISKVKGHLDLYKENQYVGSIYKDSALINIKQEQEFTGNIDFKHNELKGQKHYEFKTGETEIKDVADGSMDICNEGFQNDFSQTKGWIYKYTIESVEFKDGSKLERYPDTLPDNFKLFE